MNSGQTFDKSLELFVLNSGILYVYLQSQKQGE